MKLGLILLLLSPSLWAYEVLLPEYRGSTFSQSALTAWVDALERFEAPQFARTLPLSEVPRALSQLKDEEVLIELPGVLYHTALDQGWRTISRMEHAPLIATFSSSQTRPIKSVGSTQLNSTSYLLAEKLHPTKSITRFKDHAHCLRALVSESIDACVTIKDLAYAYADRFGVSLARRDNGLLGPPSIIVASPKFKTSLLQVVSGLRFSLGANSRYVPFDSKTDHEFLVSLNPPETAMAEQ